MPLFCIHAFDRSDAGPLRAAHYAAHRAFLDTAADWGVAVAASGPLVSDDGNDMIGSLLIVEAPTAAMLRAFHAADPFAKAGLWDGVRITRFDLRRGSVGSAA